MSTYPINGLENTGLHPRLEIRDLQKNAIQFSLLVRAWNNIQNKRNKDPNNPDYVNNPISWWQQGAIHGRPYVKWSGDPNGHDNPNAQAGYCYHASALFPTWHRVQLLLAEQSIGLEAIKIATELEKENPAARTEGWVQKAKELRLPFWDWTDSRTVTEGIPEIFQLAEIKIVNPGGGYSAPVPNPLNHYRFADGLRPGDDNLGQWPRTYRWVDNVQKPTSENYKSAHLAFLHGVEGRDTSFQTLREKIAGFFDYPDVDKAYGPNLWGHFSNTQSQDIYLPGELSKLPLPSIEDPHNSVHLNIGGNGTMADNDYAGFDPIFYLHHCNVDRLYAFWEYVYPEYWIDKGWTDAKGVRNPFVTYYPTFPRDPGSHIEDTSSLIPFRTTHSDYWTSNGVRSLLNTGPWKQKHYTYPAITNGGTKVEVHVPYEGKEKRDIYRQALRNEWGRSPITHAKNILELFKGQKQDLLQSLLLEEDGEYLYLRNFVIGAEIPEFAFAGSYRVELYLLPEVAKSAVQTIGSLVAGVIGTSLVEVTGSSAVEVIGSFSVLGRGNPEGCAACVARKAAGSVLRSHIYLDPTLVFRLLRSSAFGDEAKRHPKTHWFSHLEGSPDKSDPLVWLGNVIKWSFGWRVVDPTGKLLANADPGAQGHGLGSDKKPRLTLHSHRTKFHRSALEEEENAYIPSLKVVEGGHVLGEFELGDKWKIAV